MGKPLFDAIVGLRERDVLVLVDEAARSGREPMEVVGICREAMTEVGARFERGEYFLPELVFAADIFKRVMAIIEPRLLASGAGERKIGKVVIGTVEGDVHDIGKNIVVGMLRANGFEVCDLGADVPAEKFVEATARIRPAILGMSCLISSGWASMKRTVQAVAASDLRGSVKIIVGGGLVDQQVAEYVGADAHASDVVHGIGVCKGWVQ